MSVLDKVRATAIRYGVDPDLAVRVAWTENRGRSTGVSPKGAIGPMQLMPGTAKDLGVDPYNEDQNIDGGVRYLKQQIDHFGDHRLAVAAYNAGPGAVTRAGGVPNIRETRDYVRSTMGEPQSGADIFGMGAPQAQGEAGSGADIFAAPAAIPAPKPRPAPPASTWTGPVPQRPKVNAAKDAVYSGGTGLGQGVTAMAGGRGDIFQMASGLPVFLAEKFGIVSPEQAAQARAKLTQTRKSPFFPMGPSPTSGELDAKAGLTYEPQTRLGQGLRTAGRFATGAFMPGGAAAKIMNVVAPTLGAEGAAAVTEAAGGGKDAQEVARAVGGFGGGLATGLRLNPARAGYKAPPPAPTVEELETTKRGLYTAANSSGFTFTPASMKTLAADAAAEVRTRGGPKAAQGIPGADAMAARLSALAEQRGGVTLEQLDLLRSDIHNQLTVKGGAEAAFGGFLRRKIDALMDASSAPFIREARLANTRWEKAREARDRLASAKLAAGRANSGENLGNAIRQKFSPMIDPMHSGEVTNLTPDETSAITGLVVGDKAQNNLRSFEKFMRNPIWTAAATTPAAIAGNSLAGPQGAALGAGGVLTAMQVAGRAARRAADKRAVTSAEDLIKLMANGGVKPAPKPGRLTYIPQMGAMGLFPPILMAPSVASGKPAPAKARAKR